MTARWFHGLAFLPLAGVMTFLVSTVVLFFMGPFNWPVRNGALLALFLFSALAMIASGFIVGATGRICRGEFTYWRAVFIGGAIASCVILFPSAYVYTGKMPWDVVRVLFDQGRAYTDFLARVEELDGQRGPLVLVRALTHWAIYATVPIAVMRWSSLTWWMRLLLAGVVASSATFSILRGTDQGTFDLGYLFAVSGLIAVARYCHRTQTPILSFIQHKHGAMAVSAVFAFVVFAMVVFTERKVQRYDGRIDELCVGEDRQVCADPNHAVARLLDDRGRFGFAMATSYMTMGYYGLGLSLDRDFTSTYGVGHSSGLTRLYEMVTGDRRHYERSFTFRLRHDGWSDLYMWSSIYTWIANDVGFLGCLFVIGGLSWIWGASWRDTIAGDSDAAGIVFCMLTQTFMYSPANFQLALVLDSYLALVIWIGVWLFSTRSAR